MNGTIRNKGSVLVQVVILSLLTQTIILTLININKVQYKKSLQQDYSYQAHLCAKSAIDIVIASMNNDSKTYSCILDKSINEIFIQLVQLDKSIGEIQKVKLSWIGEDTKVLIIEVNAVYNLQTAKIKGYIKQQGNGYRIEYYESK